MCKYFSFVHATEAIMLPSDSRFQLPYSTVGSLNGIHMFCKSQVATLHSTQLEDGSLIMWREFHGAITLIAMTRGDAAIGNAGAAATTGCGPVAERVVTDLLELVFGAMVMAVGLDELCSNENADQLKRLLQTAR